MTESRERFIETRQELHRHAQPKPEFVHCCKCGKADERSNMGVVGFNVYKCWECLAGITEGT